MYNVNISDLSSPSIERKQEKRKQSKDMGLKLFAFLSFSSH
jgi:hypothetical protein